MTSEDQQPVMRIYYTLYDRLLNYRALARAFEKVRRAKGAPGVDGQTIEAFGNELCDELNGLLTELQTRTYRPQPVRRVSIPKPGVVKGILGYPQ